MNVTSDVLLALRRDLRPPHLYVWATEVPVDHGEGTRRMDAATIQATQEPFHTEGFEVKVSRGDWLNDKDGAKSEPARTAVDRFWFVFGSPDIYRLDEVPEGCGVIHVEDGQAVVVRAASLPDAHADAVKRSLLGSILTRVVRQTSDSFVAQACRVAEQKGYRKAMKEMRPSNRPVVKKRRYDPARANLDDGLALDLP